MIRMHLRGVGQYRHLLFGGRTAIGPLVAVHLRVRRVRRQAVGFQRRRRAQRMQQSTARELVAWVLLAQSSDEKHGESGRKTHGIHEDPGNRPLWPLDAIGSWKALFSRQSKSKRKAQKRKAIEKQP